MVGYGDIPVFKGYQSQYGRGLGNVLSGLLRAAVPIVAPAIKNIGQTLLNAGVNRLQSAVESRFGTSEHAAPRPLAVPPRPVAKRKRPGTFSSVRARPPKRRGRRDIFTTSE